MMMQINYFQEESPPTRFDLLNFTVQKFSLFLLVRITKSTLLLLLLLLMSLLLLLLYEHLKIQLAKRYQYQYQSG